MFVGKNILFLYSGLQQKLFMQQSIVVIKQFIDEIREIQQCKKETNFFILATTDLAKIFFDDDVVIIQDKITRSSILSAVKKYKIDAIISIVGDENNDKILNDTKLLNKKGLNIFYKEFYIANRSKNHFENIAKRSGFYLNKGKTLKDRTYYKDFVVVAIKDKYNNQHILDFFSTASIGDEKLFFAPAFLNDITDNKMDELNSKIQRFGELLSINNLIYTIGVSIDEDGRVIFNNIKYGLTNEAIFSLQRLQINIATITRKILERKVFFCPSNLQVIAYSYDYKNTFKINFAKRLEDCCLSANVVDKKNVSNKYLVDRLIDNNQNKHNNIYFSSKKISTHKNDIYVNFLSSIPDVWFNKIVDKQNDDRYVLMVLDREDVENCNNMAVFINICNGIREYTDKEVMLLCEFFPPMLSLVKFKHIIVVNNIDKNTIADIINNFCIKHIYSNIKQSNSYIVSVADELGVEMYGFDKRDVIFYNKNDESCDIFAKNIECNFKKNISNDDDVFDVFCTCDKHNNSFFKIILSRHFAGDMEANYVCYPAFFENLEIQPKIEEYVERVLENVKTSGLIHIVCVYKNGELSILDISRTTSFYYFVLNAFVKKQVIINIIVKSLLGRKIDMDIRESRSILLSPYRNSIFYRTMIFSTLSNYSISISGYSNKHIKDRYKDMVLYLNK